MLGFRVAAVSGRAVLSALKVLGLFQGLVKGG